MVFATSEEDISSSREQHNGRIITKGGPLNAA